MTSKVLIHPEKISMYGSTIEMAVGKTQGSSVVAVTALKLDADEGIWMGSSNKISLFAANNTGTNANVEISPEHIYLGMLNNNNANAVAMEITDEYLILAAGNVVDILASSSVGIDVNGDIAGLEIRSNKIGMAIGAGASRSVMIMDAGGIIVGSGAAP